MSDFRFEVGQRVLLNPNIHYHFYIQQRRWGGVDGEVYVIQGITSSGVTRPIEVKGEYLEEIVG